MKNEEIQITQENLFEFEIDENFSVFYSKTNDVWFVEDYEDDGLILILKDTKNGIEFSDIEYKGTMISEELIKKYEKIVKESKHI